MGLKISNIPVSENGKVQNFKFNKFGLSYINKKGNTYFTERYGYDIDGKTPRVRGHYNIITQHNIPVSLLIYYK